MGIMLLGFAPAELDGRTVRQIQALAPGLRVVMSTDRAEIEALVGDVEVAAGDIPPDLVAKMPKLRWLQEWGAGVDSLLRYPGIDSRDFALTNTSGIHAIPISEQIIGVLLMFARGLHSAVRAQADHSWWRPAFKDLFELSGATMLVVGFGAVGERTAVLAKALGMHVEGIRQHPASTTGATATYGPERLSERLGYADAVVLTLPLTEATDGFIGPAELRVMKPSAYLINVGRGGTVDETALAEALREGRIAGAALDTFVEEPLPATSPLWEMPNVIITAHYAGGTPAYESRAMAIFLDNLSRYQAGTALRNRVDRQAGY